MIDLSNDQLSVSINPFGAELSSLRFAGDELLWQAGPAWRRHAPVLFPIVGRLAGDTLRHRGVETRLTQHGFARDRAFSVQTHRPNHCALTLADDETTRDIYPFAFRLTLEYRVETDAVITDYALHNPADTDLFASLGTHPAFRWPLADGLDKEAHRIVFEAEERADLLQLTGGLLGPETIPSPLEGRVLPLSDSLFAHDALIFAKPASRSVRYEAPGTAAPSLAIAWEGFTELGIWSRPADFVCIEPWSGFSDAAGYSGDFADKPGVLRIAPSQTITRRLSIRVLAPG